MLTYCVLPITDNGNQQSERLVQCPFLAHLNRMLICELKEYAGVRISSINRHFEKGLSPEDVSPIPFVFHKHHQRIIMFCRSRMRTLVAMTS